MPATQSTLCAAKRTSHVICSLFWLASNKVTEWRPKNSLKSTLKGQKHQSHGLIEHDLHDVVVNPLKY